MLWRRMGNHQWRGVNPWAAFMGYIKTAKASNDNA